MNENFISWGRYLDNQVHRAQMSPKRFNSKRFVQHIGIKWSIKDKILKAIRENKFSYTRATTWEYWHDSQRKPGENGMIYSKYSNKTSNQGY